MDSLAGYIATLAVGAAGTYLSQFLKPKVNVQYWLSHSFMYTIPNNQFNPAPLLPPPAAGGDPAPTAPPHFFLLTQTLTVQNFGHEAAEWAEIVYPRKPDFFQLYPALNYTEQVAQSGEYTLRVESLAPKEFFTVQFLSYTHMPSLSHIRSNAGHAKEMPWMTVRRYPQWFYRMAQLAVLIGAGFSLYWIIKGAKFVLKSVGAF